MIEYTMGDLIEDVDHLAKDLEVFEFYDKIKYCFPIPQGGVVPAIFISLKLGLQLITIDELKKYDSEEVLVVDDLIDSGRTISKYDGYPIAVLGAKGWAPEDQKYIHCGRLLPDEWIHFWWEPKGEQDIQNHVVRLLEYIGEDPTREGLVETPARVIKSFDRLYGGYKQHPKDIMKIFNDDSCDEMVVVKDITLHSTCEHHMLPFTGKAHIAYIPDGRVIGVSKLSRLLDIFARRLQIQERIVEQVTTALMDYLKPLGAACVIEATHSCMTARGIEQQNTVMVTSSLRGVFQEKPEVRAEFMGLIR